jgi:hypothetical protein
VRLIHLPGQAIGNHLPQLGAHLRTRIAIRPCRASGLSGTIPA